MKIKKYMILTGMTATSVLSPISVLACSSSNEKPKIIIAVASDAYTYTKALSNFAKIEAEKRGYSVQIIVTNEDVVKERDKILQAVDSGNVKGVIMTPSDSESSSLIIKKLNDKHIPVIAFDRGISSINGAKLDGLISTDNTKAAKQLVEYASKLSNVADISAIYVANGEVGGSSANERKKGFNDGINEFFKKISPKPKYVVDTAGWGLDAAKTKFATLSAGFYNDVPDGKKGLIFSAAIPMTNGIVQASGFDLTKSIVVGIDIDKSNTANIINNKITVSGMQRPDIMAAWSMAKLDMIIKKISNIEERKIYTNIEFQTLAPLSKNVVKLPITIITKNNIGDIVY